MDIDRNEVIDLLERLSNARSPSGFEDETVEVVRDFCAGWATVEENTLRDALITPIRGGVSGMPGTETPAPAHSPSAPRPRVMFDAHGDEVGAMVKSIRSNGTMDFVTLGRFPEGALAGQDVLVKNAEGEWLHGTIGIKPPHFMSAQERSGAVRAPLILDVGATSAEELRRSFGVRIGAPVVPATRFTCDRACGIAVGKAFDCRAGVAAMLLALRELARHDDLAVDVVASVSAQEEVGERGVVAAARHFDPQLAFMFEGCPADDTFLAPDESQAELRRGPMFRHFDRCMITNPRYQRFVLDVADRSGLSYQESVREGGGTDAGPVHLLDVPCVVAGVPCRYVHTGTAICAIEDIEECARVAVEVVRALTPEVIAGF